MILESWVKFYVASHFSPAIGQETLCSVKGTKTMEATFLWKWFLIVGELFVLLCSHWRLFYYGKIMQMVIATLLDWLNKEKAAILNRINTLKWWTYVTAVISAWQNKEKAAILNYIHMIKLCTYATTSILV